jgi:hypothetical protein
MVCDTSIILNKFEGCVVYDKFEGNIKAINLNLIWPSISKSFCEIHSYAKINKYFLVKIAKDDINRFQYSLKD